MGEIPGSRARDEGESAASCGLNLPGMPIFSPTAFHFSSTSISIIPDADSDD